MTMTMMLKRASGMSMSVVVRDATLRISSFYFARAVPRTSLSWRRDDDHNDNDSKMQKRRGINKRVDARVAVALGRGACVCERDKYTSRRNNFIIKFTRTYKYPYPDPGFSLHL
ncbi:uncharacterized protein LOC105426798 [Pogonomyrmex barbatus]|uniref:Uncharacterized protein LOC105426798 n=1 Tax=Pogonomyrmex barbatus TaxID=144034 RepID=A0A6I9W7Y9_9HYME|nr:uncharacterized protein LOC105426798 [Pogonomyrmex barbatus]